ncbi:MAG TPA: toll/interleukin-1 receptor domain-containing protein [Silvibacterium sp.]|nr:toll/interleukin-1 receptor domain-containing protein [Silvibacterium sp.]
MKHAIFISYRRDDAEGEAGRLYDDLVRAYGNDSVFMDVAGIAPGLDFRNAIDDNVSGCGVFLAIIGAQWATITDPDGKRRLDDDNDFVRLEIASALARNIAVIPVLVHESRMPRPDQLPGNIKDLAYRNSVEISHARWNSDVQLLINALKQYVTTSSATETQPVHATLPVQLPPPVSPHNQPEAKKSNLPLIVSGVIAALLLIGGVGYSIAHKKTDNVVVPPAPVISGGNTPVNPSQPPNNATSGLAGSWRNANPKVGTDPIMELRITGSGHQFTVEPLGNCPPTLCSWGAQLIPFDGTEAVGSWTLKNTPKEARSGRVVTLTLRPAGANLDVVAQNSWRDQQGQSQQKEFKYQFVREQ